MELLTARQQDVLDAIVRLTRENRRSPTVRELMPALGIASPNGIAGHLENLEAKGAIRRGGKGESRSIQVVGFCPCCGRKDQ